MNKTPVKQPRMTYFQDTDIIHIVIIDGDEEGSVELSPNVTVELNVDGEIIGVEILNASAFLRDSILETAQARLLHGAAPITTQN